MSKMLHLQDEIMTTAREVLKNTDDMASFPNKKPTEYLPDFYVLVKYRTDLLLLASIHTGKDH
jgi:hypothetical protein